MLGAIGKKLSEAEDIPVEIFVNQHLQMSVVQSAGFPVKCKLIQKQEMNNLLYPHEKFILEGFYPGSFSVNRQVLNMILARFKPEEAEQEQKAGANQEAENDPSAQKNSSRNQALQNIVETIYAFYETFEELLKCEIAFDAFGNLLRFERDKQGLPNFKNGFVAESLMPQFYG